MRKPTIAHESAHVSFLVLGGGRGFVVFVLLALVSRGFMNVLSIP